MTDALLQTISLHEIGPYWFPFIWVEEHTTLLYYYYIMQVKLLCLVRKCAMVSHTSSFVLLGNAVDNVINNFIIKDFISPTCISSAINHKDNFYVSAHLLTAMIRMHFSIYYLLVNILKLFYKHFLLSFFLVCFDLSVCRHTVFLFSFMFSIPLLFLFLYVCPSVPFASFISSTFCSSSFLVPCLPLSTGHAGFWCWGRQQSVEHRHP